MSFLKNLFSRRPDLTRDWRAFAEHYRGKLEAALGRPVSILGDSLDDARFTATLESGYDISTSVINRFLQYQENPALLEQQIAYDLAGLASIDAENASENNDESRIFPVIKNRLWGEAHPLGDNADNSQRNSILIPLAGDLLLTFALDGEHNIRYLNRSDLAAFSIDSDDALYQLARTNFAAYAREHTRVHEDRHGVYHAELDNIYEASLLLFIDVLISAMPPLQGKTLILAVPARNHFLFCAADNHAALTALQDTVAQLTASAAHGISSLLYARDGNGNIRVYTPDSKH